MPSGAGPSGSRSTSAAETEADEALAEVNQAELYGVEETDLNDAEEVSIARNLYLDEKNIDAALKPFQRPQIPRQVQPGEPILLPLSNLGAADPTAPSSSGVAVSLPPNIFNALVRRDILHTCAVWYRASMRRGTHRTLGRSEVAFSGKKIRPQKKTGKARLGHRGSPMCEWTFSRLRLFTIIRSGLSSLQCEKEDTRTRSDRATTRTTCPVKSARSACAWRSRPSCT